MISALLRNPAIEPTMTCGDPMRHLFKIISVLLVASTANATNYELWETETVQVSYEDTPKLQSKFLRVYTMDNCPPCEAWKTQVWPKLQAKGWEEGVNVEFVYVTSNAPRFEWVENGRVKTASNGWRNADHWNAWHKEAVRDIAAEILQKSGGDPAYNFNTEETEWIHEFDYYRGDVGGASLDQSWPAVQYVSTNYAADCASGMCGPAQATYQYQTPQFQSMNCASGMCSSPQSALQYPVAQYAASGSCAQPMQQQQYAEQHREARVMRAGPVRRVIGFPFRLLGGLFGCGG